MNTIPDIEKMRFMREMDRLRNANDALQLSQMKTDLELQRIKMELAVYEKRIDGTCKKATHFINRYRETNFVIERTANFLGVIHEMPCRQQVRTNIRYLIRDISQYRMYLAVQDEKYRKEIEESKAVLEAATILCSLKNLELRFTHSASSSHQISTSTSYSSSPSTSYSN